MSPSLYTTDLVDPDIQAQAATKPRSLLQTSRTSSGIAPRRVKVTAIVTRRPDLTEVTTYKVEEINEINDSSDSSDEPLASPPLLGYRRSRTQSQSSILSDDSQLQTPSPSAWGSPDTWPITPPGAPLLPSLPSPKLGTASSQTSGSLSSRRGVGLGLDLTECQVGEQSTVTYPNPNQRGIIGEGRDGINTQGFNPFTPSDSEEEEESHYYLPPNLFSPELEMSATEFKDSVIRWVERRKRRNTHP